MMHLREEMTQIEMIELFGDSRVTREALEPGSLRNMHAHDMTFVYGEGGESIQRTTLAGSAVIELAGSGRSARATNRGRVDGRQAGARRLERDQARGP